MGQRWGVRRFSPHTEGWVLTDDDGPQGHTEGPLPRFGDEWHPGDRRYAPMHSSTHGAGELIGGLSVATAATLFVVPVLYAMMRKRPPRDLSTPFEATQTVPAVEEPVHA